MNTSTSPLARPFPELPAIDGASPRVTRAHYKAWDRADLTLITLDTGTAVAGVTTQSKCPSPEVEWCRAHLPAGRARALVVSAGNANAFTGHKGRAAVDAITTKVASHLGCPAKEIFVSATGVIGVPLPIDKAEAGLELAFSADPCGWADVAAAISTTDTFPKGAMTQAVIGGRTVTLVGVIKGSGMIAPDMATMLGFIGADVNINSDLLQDLTREAADLSFNAITIDGDTSTNDSFIVMATGQSAVSIQSKSDPAYAAFREGLITLSRQLAQMIVRDGEGATKFITIRVKGGKDSVECKRIAKSIAHSPLVKTAFFASDPNLGRILAAIGYAGVGDLDSSKVQLWLGDVWVAKDGGRNPDYKEADGQAVMKQSEISVTVDLGRGNVEETVWTCDLSHEYVSINADYRS